MIGFKRYFVFCFIVLNIVATGLAQDLNLYFDHINYGENFSPSMISSLVQSKKGFVWIGTENGLFRYDGYSFKRYIRDKNAEGSISNNHINVIFEDSDEVLWVGTNNGLNLFNKNTNDFLNIDILPIKGGRNYITSLVEDGNKNVWIGTFGGVKRLNKESHVLENISNDSNYELNHSRVLSLFYDQDYGVIVGTSQGLKCFDPLNGSLEKKLPDVFYNKSVILNSKIWKTIKDANDDLWFATETNGVFLYSKERDTIIQYHHDFNDDKTIASNWVNDIILADDNTIWFATNNGLSVFKKDREEFETFKHNPLNATSLSDNSIECFLKDRHGSIWLGTIGGGVNLFNKVNSNFINIGETVKPNFGLNNAIVNAVIEDDDSSLWVGTYGGGLNLLDFKTNASIAFLIDAKDDKRTSNLITALEFKDPKSLFCGTYQGLYEFNKIKKEFSPIPLEVGENSKSERPIMALLRDKDELWVATNGNGLKKVSQNGNVESYVEDGSPNSLTDNFVMDIENREGGLWLATQDGLNYFDKNLKKITKVYRTEGENSISNNSLTVLFTDSKNRLWIGADYDGLNCFDEKSETFFVLNKKRGLTDATIKSISEDSQGNIWVSAEDLLFKIAIDSAAVNLKNASIDITSYSSKDGVSVKQFSHNCSLLLKNNEMVFGATKGITVFSPEKIVKYPNDSEIVFTKLVVNNEVVTSDKENSILTKPISETSEITVNYEQGYLGFEFSNLNFVNPKKSKYSYKLDNGKRKDDWHNNSTQNRVNLNGLVPGEYQLSIRSSNEDGVWSPKIKTFKINVLPPWWQTWWSYLVYFTLFLLGVFVVFKLISNRLKLKKRLFLEHVESERKQEMLNMQLNFFTNISHEIRTPLTLIKGPVEELLEEATNDSATAYKLKTIQQNSERLLKLVNELLDFRKSEKGHMRIYCQKQDIVAFCFEIYESFKGLAAKKNIEYKFVLNSSSVQVYFDKDQLEKVIFNLLSNAFKFTKKNGKVVFVVEQMNNDDKKVFIKIKDNGIGIPVASKDNIFNRFFQVDDRGSHNMGSGVGLALSKTIVELHKGTITIPEDHESWANTVFQIELLLGKDHLNPDQIDDNEIANESNSDEAVQTDSMVELEDFSEVDFLYDDFDPDKKTVFAVEDNDEVRKFICNILKDDYNVLDFSNAKDAMAYMEQEIPDLIISDIMMPEIDGLQFCKHIKTNESTNHLPVILLTAKASVDNKVEGLSMGADAYISKPFSTKILMLSVQNLLKSKEILRQKYSGNFIVDSNLDNLTTPEEVFLKKLMKIIEENLENPAFDVSMLVDKIGMSRTILYKKVNTLTSHSVASLIKHIRLKKAADIILKTSYPISEVAFMVGFNDRKHFSREFKKVYQCSPTKFKDSQDRSEMV